MLAAIVFTDVVSFSARMQREEVATLSLLERDFTFMRQTCEKYSGAVLKTTGDGLLLYFTSAVQAVACAQKMQREFNQRLKDAPSEALKHRIGIHLGEVFVKDQDVMGDGVNIAARIQSQAEPGGIVISQTVYDVVKNKLKLDVAKLGVRELKNISEAVTMYRVLLEAPKPAPVEPAPRRMETPVEVAEPAMSGARKLLIAAGLLVGLGIAGWLFTKARAKHDEELARSEAERAKIPGAVAAYDQDLKNANASSDEKVAAYDFLALALQPATAQDAAAARQKASAQMQPLLAWIGPELERYTKDRPLLVPQMGAALPDSTTIFTGADRKVYFAEGGAIRGRDWESLKPGVRGAIVVSAISNATTPPSNEVIRGAEAYAYVHRLPDMAAALRRLEGK